MQLQVKTLVSAVCACLILALALPLGASAAKPKAGQLDRSFGTKGKVIGFAPESPAEQAIDPIGRPHTTDLAVGPGSTIAVAVGTTIAEFEADGRPRRSFGERGRVTVSVPGEEFELAGIAIDGQGRVVVAGTATPGPSQSMLSVNKMRGISPSRAAVLRFTPDGTLDPSFGDGGVFISDLGAPHPTEVAASQSEWPQFENFPGWEYTYPKAAVHVTGIALDDLERPVLSGYRVAGTYSSYCSPANLYRLAIAARLDQSGNLDPRFGTAGLSTAPGEPLVAPRLGPEVGSDPITLGGQTLLTVVSGVCTRGGGQAATVDLLGEAGEANAGFGSGGKLSFELQEGGSPLSALDPKGRILVAEANELSYGKGEIRVRRYSPEGRLQKDLGQRKATASAAALGVDAHSRPLLLTRIPPPGEPGSYRRLWSLQRLRTSGAVDRRFGHGGSTTIGFGRLATVNRSEIVVDSKGRILVVAHREVKGRPELGGFFLARFLSK